MIVGGKNPDFHIRPEYFHELRHASPRSLARKPGAENRGWGIYPYQEVRRRFLRLLIAAEDFLAWKRRPTRRAGRQQQEIRQLSQDEPEGCRTGRSTGSVLDP